MPRYHQYLKNQTKEIIDNYGPLGIMWFDGEWEKPWTREYGNELYDYLMKVQPTLIINNRVSKGRQGMTGTTEESHLNSGDYDTPEQQIGGFNRDRPWETCMTICQQWAWKPDDQMKSAKECIQTLLRTVGGDGNLLFNVGPMPDGRIEPRQVERLKEMGSWLQEHGDGVYATRGGPFKPGKWGASTCKDDKVYLYVMNWRADGRLMLPGIGRKIVSCRAHDGGEVLLKQNEDAIEVHLESFERNEIAVVVELTVDGVASTIDPVEVSEVDDVVLDPGVTSARILLLEPDHEVGDVLRDFGSPGVLAVLAAVALLGDEFSAPTEDRVWREQDRSCLQEFSRQAFGLCGQSCPLAILQQNAFVLPLLLLQDPDLLFEAVDGFPEFPIDTIGQARHQRKPEGLFDSPDRLINQGVACKRFRQAMTQPMAMTILTLG
jgi:hypothetical protein